MEDVRLIAVDPGLMTGVAMWQPSMQTMPRTLEVDTEELFAFISETLHDTFVRYVIVCEAYTISERTLKATRQAWSLEIIGILRWMAWKRGHTFVEPMQQAAEAKSFVTNDRLKAIGWYTPGRGHANDALRHLFLYVVKNRLVPMEMMLP